MNAETDAPQPAPMTEFERLALKLLHSIDQRLSVISEDVNYFRRLNQSARDSMAQMAKMSQRWSP